MRCLPLATAILLAPASALAQISPTDPNAPEPTRFVATEPPRPPPPPSAWETTGRRGLELEVRFGVMLPNGQSPVQSANLYPGASYTANPTGDILDGKEAPYGPSPFGLSLSLGYRFLPWLSAGASFSYASFWVNDGTDTGDYSDSTSQLERQYWSLAAYARYYVIGLHPRVEPWLELGVGYSDDNANYVRLATQGSGTAELQQYLLEEQGVVASLTAGLDWRLAPVFSVGPSVGYSRTFATKACATVNVDPGNPLQINNLCSGPVQGDGYGVFFAGAFAKLTYDPWLH